MASQIRLMLDQQRDLMIQQRNMYLAIAEELNSNYIDIMKDNHDGDSFLRSVTYDVAGQLSTTYLGLNDLNITTDQIVRRTLNFSYDNDYDPLKDEMARKDPLNSVSENDFNEVTQAEEYYMNHSNKEFGRSADRSKSGQNGARTWSNGVDDLTGKEDSRLEADHVIARSIIKTPNWLGKDGREAIQNNNESLENFQMINWKVNRIKSSNQVYQNEKTGEIIGKGQGLEAKKIPDGYRNITDIAGATELNKAFISAQERTYRDALKTLADPNASDERHRAAQLNKDELEKSIINPETGKVADDISKKNFANLKKQLDKNDRVLVQGFFKKEAIKQNAATAAGQSLLGREVRDKQGNVMRDKKGRAKRKGGLKDLITGQIVYYALPPLVFEVREFFSKQKKGYNGLVKRLGRSVNRLADYVFNKLKDIFKNVVAAFSRNFVRAMMDLLISTLKGALKGVFKVLKDFLMSIVSSIKILANNNMSAAEKGSAIVNLMTTTLVAVGVQALFELIPQGTAPEWVLMPIQIIVTAVLSALAMRILEENDLFNIQRGMKLAKLRKVFDDSISQFNDQSDAIASKGHEITQKVIAELDAVKTQTTILTGLNYYSDDAWPALQKINDTFDMGIDFDEEWQYFASV